MTKTLVRRLLESTGYDVLHRTSHPVLAEMRRLYDVLRLNPQDRLTWQDRLPLLAAHAHLGHLLELHEISHVIDVGANRGQFAQLTRTLGYNGEIISFEPIPAHFEKLRELADKDGNWRVFPFALGRSPATAELSVFEDDTFSSFYQVNGCGRSRFGGMVERKGTVNVRVETLDSLAPAFVSAEGKRRIFLKSDTQGHDLEVLAGAGEVMRSVNAIMIEAPVQAIYETVPTLPAILETVGKRGFELSGLFPTAHHPNTLALIELDAFFTRRPTRSS
jgi:FkbM family methyltransferase